MPQSRVHEETIDRYARSIDILWNAYTTARRELYTAERRWPEEPFRKGRSSPC